MALLLAVLEKRAGQKTYNQDVYVNVAGGLELGEPAADLALCVAVASTLKDTPVGQQVAVMGEVGLGGEVRAIPQIERPGGRVRPPGLHHHCAAQGEPAPSQGPRGRNPAGRGHGVSGAERTVLNQGPCPDGRAGLKERDP